MYILMLHVYHNEFGSLKQYIDNQNLNIQELIIYLNLKVAKNSNAEKKMKEFLTKN